MTPEEAAKKAQTDEMNQILFKDYKQFVDSTRLYFANNFFALKLSVGPEGSTFVLTPYLAKTLSHIFAAQVDNYEKHFGTINITAPALSPVQLGDLRKPGDPDGSGGSNQKPPTGPKGKKK